MIKIVVVIGIITIIIIIIKIITGGAQNANHIVLTPLGRGGKEVALLIVPEVGLENTAYEELAAVLQFESGITLWVCLLDTKTDGPLTPDSLGETVIMGLEELTVKGMNAEDAAIFVAGHGRGGAMLATYVAEVPDFFSGIILMGTYLKPQMKASAFPVPIMTITGDLDGISRITSVAEAFRSMRDDVAFDSDLIYHSPLVIMDGFNHGVFSSGELPGNMQTLDIRPEGSIEDGQRLVTNCTALFIAHTMNAPAAFVKVAKIQFREAYEKAVFITKPILEVKEMTQNPHGESYFVRVAQKWLSGLQGDQSTRLTVESYIVGEATEIPPSVLAEGHQSVVITFSDVLRAQTQETDDDEKPEAPVEIAARMLSPQRIKKELGDTNITKLYTCRDLNYGSYLTAYNKASETARRRFDNSHKGIIFHTDMLVQSDLAWKLTQLLVEVKEHELHVTAISYMTPNLDTLGERAGLYYCKILPPDRAIEWIYVDSLRLNMPS
ncbi:uncharacterized protein [Haliotis cracherodii]|uniref:uncharacterized protein n=1 Tax=Haliotis cracherodii TaxID=6455 RepID=UPI0039ECBCEE